MYPVTAECTNKVAINLVRFRGLPASASENHSAPPASLQQNRNLSECLSPIFFSLSFAHGPELKNRLLLAPLTNKQSNEDGTVSDYDLAWIERWPRAATR